MIKWQSAAVESVPNLNPARPILSRAHTHEKKNGLNGQSAYNGFFIGRLTQLEMRK
jgi:hypothetical protein